MPLLSTSEQQTCILYKVAMSIVNMSCKAVLSGYYICVVLLIERMSAVQLCLLADGIIVIDFTRSYIK